MTDNVSKFTTRSISQANDLETRLNADLELQRRAKEQGYKGVGVAIHSSLSPSEQESRKSDFEAGKYMALIGDKMFLEAYDHPPIKNLFCSSTCSLVEKVQTIGRPGRKYFNERKERFEGANIIDTYMYLAFEDPDQERKNLNLARKNLVTAKDILHEEILLSPGCDLRSIQGKSTHRRSPVMSGMEVKSIVSEESFDVFESERSKMDNKIILTLSDIKRAVDQYRENQDGKNPVNDTTEVTEGGLTGTTWLALGASLRFGRNGLSDDPEYQEWRKELEEQDETPGLASLKTTLVNENRIKRIGLADIKNGINTYLKDNDGNYPSAHSCEIKNEMVTVKKWGTMNGIIAGGKNGLSEDPEYLEWCKELEEEGKKPSLAQLKITMGRDKEKKLLTMQQIKNAIGNYRENNNGKNPTKKLKKEESIALEKSTWGTLNQSIETGRNGLADDPVWQELRKKHNGKLSLFKLCNEFDKQSEKEDESSDNNPDNDFDPACE